MSALTQCNYCTLGRLRRKYGDRLILSTRADGWTEQRVDGRPIGAFAAITDHCVCDDDGDEDQEWQERQQEFGPVQQAELPA